MSTSARTVEQNRRGSLPGDRPTAALLTSGAITALTLAVAFGLLALDVEAFWLAFPVGFGVVLPAALGVVTHLWPDEDGETADSDTRTPMEELRLRFARGELSEAEFERRARLLDDEE